jgi:hypothetical protein
MSIDHRRAGAGRIDPDSSKERYMRSSADRLVAILAAALVMGCNPGTPTVPPKGPAPPSVIVQPGPKAVAGSGLKKKQKEPGLGKAMPKAYRRRDTAL